MTDGLPDAALRAQIEDELEKAGLQVTVREVSTELLDKGFTNIDKGLARLVQRGALTAAERDAARKRLRGTTRVEDLAGCDFIIEAVKLVEGGLSEFCDEVWLVTCEPAEQRTRIVRSRGSC